MQPFSTIPLQCLLLAVLTFLTSVSAESVEVEQVEQGPQSYREAISKLSPMDTEGMNPKIANILQKYYDRTFGGSENWEIIQSVRFDGLLHLSQGTVRFVAFKKKPDYCKVVIFAGERARIVMAYDGEEAWQLNTSNPEAKSSLMPEKEARNFIRDATIAGHLVYPGLVGKQINILGTTVLDGSTCYKIEQILPDGQRILSALDVVSLAERKQITLNAVNGLEEEIIFSDFREIEGVRFPFASTMESGGEVIHRVEMLNVQVNLGVMPWMFQRPSGAYVPGEVPAEIKIDPEIFKQSEEVAPLGGGFGLDPANQTAFPDLEESEVESILDDIGKPIR